LSAAKERAALKAAEHKIFSPEELVSRFPLFANLTSEQREVLILHFHSRDAHPGQRVIRAGDKADAVYFIVEGEVEVSVAKHRVKLVAGDFFGEMALITGQPRSADVTAIDYCKFLTLNQQDFRLFLRKFPDIRERVADLAAERERMNQELKQQQEKPA
jgi:CPA2 family monovalent cation:H+ antiporter-2